jgi:hypothetical protein
VRAHKPVHHLLLLTAGCSLLLCPTAFAQRRVIAPPGMKPAVTSQKAPADSAAKDEEAKEKSEPAQSSPGAVETAPAASAPSAAPARQPANAPDETEPAPEPEKPQVLLPKDEPQTKPAAEQAQVTAPPSREVVYRKKVDKAIVTLRVRPAKPQPNRAATLVFEVAELLIVPDPLVGDRKPVENGLFSVDVSLDGKSARRLRLHKMTNAGAYGTHVTVPEAGVYRVALVQKLEKQEIGTKPIQTEFLLGFGKETPMEEAADEEDDDAVQVRRGRRALRVASAKATTAPDLMTELGEHWMSLDTALGEEQPQFEELDKHAQALAQLAPKIETHFRAPPAAGANAKELEALAAGLKPLADLPEKIAKPAAARESMAETARASCNRCHVKFRFKVSDDVSGWPKFAPKAPTK